MMHKILITGGIGTGKSTVIKLFENYLPSHQFTDMDGFVNSLYENQTTQFKNFLLEYFNTTDKKEVSLIVFSDMVKKDILDSYLFGRVEEYLELWLNNDSDSVMEFPLFFEMIEKSYSVPTSTKICSKILESCDIITIRANDDIRIQRIIERSKVKHPTWTKETIQGIIVSQMNSTQKEQMSDYVIDNSYSLENTEDQVKLICEKFGEQYA